MGGCLVSKIPQQTFVSNPVDHKFGCHAFLIACVRCQGYAIANSLTVTCNIEIWIPGHAYRVCYDGIAACCGVVDYCYRLVCMYFEWISRCRMYPDPLFVSSICRSALVARDSMLGVSQFIGHVETLSRGGHWRSSESPKSFRRSSKCQHVECNLAGCLSSSFSVVSLSLRPKRAGVKKYRNACSPSRNFSVCVILTGKLWQRWRTAARWWAGQHRHSHRVEAMPPSWSAFRSLYSHQGAHVVQFDFE